MPKKIFPEKKYKNFKEYYFSYVSLLGNFLNNNFIKNLSEATNLIEEKILKKKNIFVCGNGGSAAIANHYVCDYLKLLTSHTNLKTKIISLCSHSELISAIANDISYDKIFSYQINALGQKDDLLIIISCSGNSKNIQDVIKVAKKKKISTLGFCGFDGGYVKKNSDISVHVNINNYGITEDIFHIFMHVIMQFIRQKYLKSKIVKKIKF
jgi:D-sedoheptulose 7-phosphate isomerase